MTLCLPDSKKVSVGLHSCESTRQSDTVSPQKLQLELDAAPNVRHRRVRLASAAIFAPCPLPTSTRQPSTVRQACPSRPSACLAAVSGAQGGKSAWEADPWMGFHPATSNPPRRRVAAAHACNSAGCGGPAHFYCVCISCSGKNADAKRHFVRTRYYVMALLHTELAHVSHQILRHRFARPRGGWEGDCSAPPV